MEASGSAGEAARRAIIDFFHLFVPTLELLQNSAISKLVVNTIEQAAKTAREHNCKLYGTVVKSMKQLLKCGDLDMLIHQFDDYI